MNGNRVVSNRIDPDGKDVLGDHRRLNELLTRPFLNARGALTMLPEVGILVCPFVTIAPSYKDGPLFNSFYLDRHRIHKNTVTNFAEFFNVCLPSFLEGFVDLPKRYMLN
jgi:hypothetical protein